MGLVQVVTPSGQQLDRAVDIARQIASYAPLGGQALLGSAISTIFEPYRAPRRTGPMESSSQARIISGSTGLPRTPIVRPPWPIRPSCRERKPGNLLTATRQFPIHPQGRFKADNGTALAAAAVAGLGIAWLPDHLIKGYLGFRQSLSR